MSSSSNWKPGYQEQDKDTTHVLDEELPQILGEKVPNRRYCYKNAIVEKATTLAEELYMPIYQVDSLRALHKHLFQR